MSVDRVEKPWGYELHWAKTERYVGKVLHITAGHALSLQYHNVKDETVYVHEGKVQWVFKKTMLTVYEWSGCRGAKRSDRCQRPRTGGWDASCGYERQWDEIG